MDQFWVGSRTFQRRQMYWFLLNEQQSHCNTCNTIRTRRGWVRILLNNVEKKQEEETKMNQSSPHTKIIQRCSSSNMHKIDLLWRRNMIFKAFNLQIREETRKTDLISLCYIPHRSYYSIFPLCSVREEFLLIFFFFWVIVISTRATLKAYNNLS